MAHESSRSPACAALLSAAVLAACGTGGDAAPADTTVGSSEPPKLLNEVLPVAYPGTLWARGVTGEVTLRLFVDSSGTVVPDSTRVETPSGEPQLDSAALRGVPDMRFTPALVGGQAVSASLLVPVLFSRDTLPADTTTSDSAPPG